MCILASKVILLTKTLTQFFFLKIDAFNERKCPSVPLYTK